MRVAIDTNVLTCAEGVGDAERCPLAIRRIERLPEPLTAATTAKTANFGGGDVTGSVTQFVVVPEPSTLALAGLGVALAGYAAWKRRRTA